MNHPDAVTGDHSGVPFPTTIEPLLARGAEFLTAAFQARRFSHRSAAVLLR